MLVEAGRHWWRQGDVGGGRGMFVEAGGHWWGTGMKVGAGAH